ncbi:Mfs1.2 [Amylocystis lapponica]|nr:Mfs1.2 [Amylocystis lapponica]
MRTHLQTGDTGVSSLELNNTLSAKARGARFWLLFFALFISFLLVLLENASVGTALPTIAHDLNATQFAWIGTAYGISATAFLPLCGGLTEAFGRRPVMIVSLFVFALGSALAGSAQSFSWLIAARGHCLVSAHGSAVIQGLGGGGLTAVPTIIVSDLVPLRERGLYSGLLGLAWSIAGGIGPLVGGALSKPDQWRWIFYLTLPLCGVAVVLVVFLLRLPTPPGTLRTKLAKLDWIGNVIVVSASVSLTIGVTWGGVQYPWGSVRVLAPLTLGIAGLVSFFVYELLWSQAPMVSSCLLSNRTSISGYFQTTILSINYLSILYYLPVYFQACKLASPLGSGVDLLATSMIVSPMTIAAGVFVTLTKTYRAPIWAGWTLVIAGMTLLGTLHADSPRVFGIGFQVLTAVGIGLVFTSTYFPVLAPIPVALTAPALSFYVFLRSFGQIWGVVVGSTILQNELARRLPYAFAAQFPAGAEIAYEAIPVVPALAPALQGEVRAAFADALAVLWRVNAGIAAAGLACSLLMRALPLHTETDARWRMQDGEESEETVSVGGMAKEMETGTEKDSVGTVSC